MYLDTYLKGDTKLLGVLGLGKNSMDGYKKGISKFYIIYINIL